MILNLSLLITDKRPFAEIPINYQYPFSKVIYQKLNLVDPKFASILHQNAGYKRFKLFTFSDIRAEFLVSGDRMIFKKKIACITLAAHQFKHINNAMTDLYNQQQIKFIDNITKAFLEHPDFKIYDSRSCTNFHVDSIDNVSPNISNQGGYVTALLMPISPVVCGTPNVRGYLDYVSPYQKDFAPLLILSLVEKYRIVYNLEEDQVNKLKKNIWIKVIFFQHEVVKERVISYKQYSREEKKIRGYMKFEIQVHAPVDAIELILNSGIGINNTAGMGCVKLIHFIGHDKPVPSETPL